MDIQEIMQILPHRYPFLLVDKIIECELHERIVAIKNVTMNEEFFQGHFPKKPVMPGVLILEAMAQACGVLAFKSQDSNGNGDQVVLLAGCDKVRYKRQVVPGDQLRLEASIDKVKRGIWMFTARAMVGDEKAAEASILCTLKDL